MLFLAVGKLQMDMPSIIGNVAALAMEAICTDTQKNRPSQQRLIHEIQSLQEKKERVMDAYFSGDISREEMLCMKKRYSTQILVLEGQQRAASETSDATQMLEELRQTANAILQGSIISELFCKTILEQISVYKNKDHVLKLTQLPVSFHFRT